MAIAVPVAAADPVRLRARDAVHSIVGAVTPRRGLQLALGTIWLVDAILQYQPYMFTKGFVTSALASTAAGNPAVVAHPITWASHIMVQHIVVYNAVFATIQLAIGLGLFWRRSVKLALAASIPWAVAVWWFGEGLGGVLTGAVNPFTGAPGAVILYAFIALLVWPRHDSPSGELGGDSVATSGPLGATAPRALALALWASFIYMTLQPVNRDQTSLGAMVSGMDYGEPGWIRAMDHSLGSALMGHGAAVAFAFIALFAVAGIGIFVPALRRIVVTVGIAVGIVIWVVEDFGGIFSGQGTDVNSGLLIVLLAATFWPIRAVAG